MPFPEFMSLNKPARFGRISRLFAVTTAISIAVTAIQLTATGLPAGAAPPLAGSLTGASSAAQSLPLPPQSTMVTGQLLLPGTALVANGGGQPVMIMQRDGNLVERN